MEVHVSINTNGSTKELQRLTDRLGDLANLLEAITEAELSRSSNSYFAAGLDEPSVLMDNRTQPDHFQYRTGDGFLDQPGPSAE